MKKIETNGLFANYCWQVHRVAALGIHNIISNNAMGVLKKGHNYNIIAMAVKKYNCPNGKMLVLHLQKLITRGKHMRVAYLSTVRALELG